MPKKITHEEFIEKLKLIKPHVEVISQYNGNKNYITVRCTIHNHTWNSKPNWLIQPGKCDCQKCYDERRGESTQNGLKFFTDKGNELCEENGLKLIYVTNCTYLSDKIFENKLFLNIYNKNNTICAIDNKIEQLLLNKLNTWKKLN